MVTTLEHRVSATFPSDELVVRLIDSEEGLQRVLGLRYRAYLAAGYYENGGIMAIDRMEVPDKYEGNATNIVLQRGTEITGAVRVIHDGPMGLSVDKLYDFSALRAYGAVLAEPSRFVVEPYLQGNNHSDMLLHALWQYAQEAGITHYGFSARPQEVGYYLRFGPELLATEIQCHDGPKVFVYPFLWTIAKTEESFARRWASNPFPRLTPELVYA